MHHILFHLKAHLQNLFKLMTDPQETKSENMTNVRILFFLNMLCDVELDVFGYCESITRHIIHKILFHLKAHLQNLFKLMTDPQETKSKNMTNVRILIFFNMLCDVELDVFGYCESITRHIIHKIVFHLKAHLQNLFKLMTDPQETKSENMTNVRMLIFKNMLCDVKRDVFFLSIYLHFYVLFSPF